MSVLLNIPFFKYSLEGRLWGCCYAMGPVTEPAIDEGDFMVDIRCNVSSYCQIFLALSMNRFEGAQHSYGVT